MNGEQLGILYDSLYRLRLELEIKRDSVQRCIDEEPDSTARGGYDLTAILKEHETSITAASTLIDTVRGMIWG